MLRRDAISLLLTAAGPPRLDRYLGGGVAVLVDVRTRRLAAHGGALAMAERSLTPPGSTLKPFVFAALLRAGRLDPTAAVPCPGRLRLAGRVFDCVHPRLDTPLHLTEALAYSCNCYAAKAAARFAPGELARALEHAGVGSPTGRVEPVTGADAQILQALGERGVLVSPAGLALAYARLAARSAAPELQPVLTGMEAAVEFGTAQHARVAGLSVAGKTGSVLTAAGGPVAWFAGFAPSRSPAVAVAVMLPGRSGGADAAPAAARILTAWKAGTL